MKYAKLLGLLAVAATALMAFAGSASATTINIGPRHLQVGDIITATSTNSELTGTINISCAHSHFEGVVTNAGGDHGGAGPTTPVSGHVKTLSFTQCGNHTVSVLKAGSVSIESIGGGAGTLTSTGAEVTVLTHSLFLGTRHCIYTTNNTDVGKVVGGKPAHFTAASAPIPQTSTDSLCGNDAKWDGTYTITEPAHLTIS